MPNYEEEARDLLRTLRQRDLTQERRAETIAHAQVLATLEIGNEIFRLNASLNTLTRVIESQG